MINFHPHTKKEVCGICSKQILIGHPTIVCNSCDDICHKNALNQKPINLCPFETTRTARNVPTQKIF